MAIDRRFGTFNSLLGYCVDEMGEMGKATKLEMSVHCSSQLHQTGDTSYDILRNPYL